MDTSTLPPGKFRLVVTYFEMHAPPAKPLRPAPEGLRIERVHQVPIHFYRYLHGTVGQACVWWERRDQTDAQLVSELHSDVYRLYVPYLDGAPAGLMECRETAPQEIQLNYFGIFREHWGRGLGGYLLRWLAETLFAEGVTRFWLHTCNLDSANAIPAYRAAGFTQYDEKVSIIDDPRLRKA